ncbi:flagellar motor switch protein FliM [Croceibacterium aestuarii]|uniref:flagellar motor switch protein FliM n=1 Tax=Croceibacterium aestuarii TaxID=3064139 RepID=UPI00272EAF09|nr:FliM/FliN family flagellar motor C-terminal domain-containing protein [Croceibacterium sp. D39]
MIHQDLPRPAQRAAAHCDALFKRAVAPAEFADDFARLGERLAMDLRRALAAACNDPAVRLRSLGAGTLAAGELADLCGSLAANSLHSFGKCEDRLLLSLEGRGLLEQIDRAFGGTGDIGDKLPAELPLSAGLLAQRIHTQAAAALAEQLGIEIRTTPQATNAAQVTPFATGAEIAVLRLEVSGSEGRPWLFAIAVETGALPLLLPRRPSSPAQKSEGRRPGIGEAPFADLPLTAGATLVDMSIPLHRLAALEPGTVLPIMVARNVPLQIGEICVARGSIGEVDEQVALQITQTFSRKDSQ